MPSKTSGAVTLATSLGATAVARKAIDATWKLGAGKKPPTDPTDPDVKAREAMLWAVLSGAAIGLAKMWASRRLAQSERKEAGSQATHRASS